MDVVSIHAIEDVHQLDVEKLLRIRQIGLGMGAGAIEGGEGLIEHRNDPLLLVYGQFRDRPVLEHLRVHHLLGGAHTPFE